LDVHTARWIVDKCFKGDLIRGRTVLLVVSWPFARSAVFVTPLQTHNVAMASPLAEYVVSLGPDGRIACRGSVSDALKKDKRLAAELVKGARAIKDDEKKIDQEEPDAKAKQADGKLILAEEIAEGRVSRDACNCCLSLRVSHDAHLVAKLGYSSIVWEDPMSSYSGSYSYAACCSATDHWPCRHGSWDIGLSNTISTHRNKSTSPCGCTHHETFNMSFH
jgi:hypothetical protein